MATIKLLLADDHQMIRNGIKLMLKKNVEFEVVAEASSGEEVISYLERNAARVDVILMDINMPGMGGIEATEIITKKYSTIKVLALTMHSEETFITSMMKVGALGYILKEADTNELIMAINTVALGKKYYSNEVSVAMINALMSKDNSQGTDLSDREIEVLKYIAAGDTNKEAGEKLFISPRTVETHRRNILSKLDVKNTAEMIKYAYQHQLIE
ncbi:MAG: DNA-binding response regulator [Flavobacteriales bacterium CG_4_10_14_0_2_um_filter_32_8]|nr:MAG: DNA-binding response regulator [Flavobacteriales bacterium CG_4_10_14_0_2_um_filter_32_8]